LSAEKRALKRFLFIYIFSTLLVVGVGEWFYYKLALNNIKSQEHTLLKNELKTFLERNPFLMRAIRFRSFDVPKGLNLIIYFNNEKVFSNTKLQDIKEVYIEKKRWGEIKIVATKKFPYEKLKNVFFSLIIFNLFLLVFLFAVAYFLGKLFLKPMKESIENLENFIRDATHEMNTPISIINSNIEMLEIKGVEFKEFERIKFATKRLDKIFQDLKFLRLNFSKNMEDVNLKPLIKERLKVFETIMEKKRLRLDVETDDFVVKINKEEALRIIDNLLSNAFKYAPNDSKIEVCLKNGCFRVVNEGVIKNINKLTRKFYRENTSEGGFGLGLYIVSEICKKYGFEFQIKNQNNRVIMQICF